MEECGGTGRTGGSAARRANGGRLRKDEAEDTEARSWPRVRLESGPRSARKSTARDDLKTGEGPHEAYTHVANHGYSNLSGIDSTSLTAPMSSAHFETHCTCASIPYS